MKNTPGVNTHKDKVTVCMVVGCYRVALYQGRSGRRSARGYCDKHKQLAVATDDSCKARQLQQYLDRRADSCSDSATDNKNAR